MFRDARWAFAIAVAMINGCGRTLPETAPVEGSVTLDGQPLTAGKIMFWPKQGRPAMGKIGPDGRYRLTTFVADDGALIGAHDVTIEATRVVGGRSPASFADEIAHGMGSGTVQHLVPKSYGDRTSSGLSAVVEAKQNRIDFPLSE